MSSLARARQTLGPLISHLSRFHTPHELDALLQAYIAPRRTTFRFNTLKVTSKEEREFVLSEIQATLKQSRKRPLPRLTACPWYKEAYSITNPAIQVKHLAGLPAHKQGKIHFQSWSSMLTPLCLGTEPGVEHILDMCAAPGGKTQMLAEALGGKGQIVANELDHERAQRLRNNVKTLLPAELQKCIRVQVADGRKLTLAESTNAKYQTEAFDAIMLDAPCSGEGIISMSEPSSYRHWSLSWVERHARLQRQLLTAAYHVLRPGGLLIYSTCTLSPEENEEVIEWFLDRHPNVDIIPLALPFFGEWSGRFASFLPGLSNYKGRNYRPALNESLRVFPNAEYEGFFVCRMKKRR